ncbi:hypothetical protein [Orenia marismortui]|uniref:Type IV pilus assembly protein PilM n=1 Tax=Orenia marismortui TaxID=46469 RepID=A0A4R8H6R6_9FIRM|nr:hypothetical protein [Orenia marismortui]TDX53276.1 hypothetical protein C7959_103129 [Orenia marismortui]
MDLFTKQRSYLEVDDNYIRLVQLKKNNILYQDSFKFEEELKDINLKDYLDQARYKIKKISLIVPATKLFIRRLELPLTAKDKLKDIIKLQVLRKLPYRIEDLYYSYQILDKKDKLLVLVFTVTKDYINMIYELFANLGLIIDSIIPSSLVFYYLYQKDKVNLKNQLYIDLSPNYIHYTFYNQNDIYIRSSQNIGDLAEETADTVIYLKQKYNLEDDPKLFLNGEKIDDKKAVTLNSFEEIRENNLFWKKIRVVEKNLAGVDILSQISLKQKEKQKKDYSRLFYLTILVLLVNGTSLFLAWQLKINKLNNFEVSNKQISPLVEKVQQVKIDYQANKKKVKLLKGQLRRNYSYLPWLKELSLILSEDVKVDKVIFKEEKLVLLAGEANSATKVMSLLEESDYFKNLHFEGSIVSKEDREEFRIAGDLEDAIK